MTRQEQQDWLNRTANKKLQWNGHGGFLVVDPNSLTDGGQFNHRFKSHDFTIDGNWLHGSIGYHQWVVIGDYEDPIVTNDPLPILEY